MPESTYASLPRAVRVDADVHAHLKEMAERQHRTITNLIGHIILEAVNRDKSEENDHEDV